MPSKQEEQSGVSKDEPRSDDPGDWVKLCEVCRAFCNSSQFQALLNPPVARLECQIEANYWCEDECELKTLFRTTASNLIKCAEDCWLCRELRDHFEAMTESLELFKAVVGASNSIIVEVRAVHVKKDPWASAKGFEVQTLGVTISRFKPQGIAFLVEAAEGNHAASHISPRPYATYIKGVPWASRYVAKMAKRLIRECETSHSDCPLLPQESLPLRVLDVASEPSKLYLTNGEKAQYATLSYRSGKPRRDDKIRHLTFQTLPLLQAGVDVNELPRVFADAIKTTRSLGLRYLWIDALCINQDDDLEKKAEIACLRRTIQGSYLTIVASGARSVNGSFVKPAFKSGYPSLRIPFTCECHLSGVILLRRKPSGMTTEAQLREDATDPRSWCLVEKLLSPRQLIFAAKDVLWRCQSVSRSAGGHLKAQERIFMDRLPARLHAPDSTGPLSPREKIFLQKAWWKVVREYASRRLVHRNDVLLGISPLAQAFQRVTDSTYLAGLWKNSIGTDLLWYCGSDIEAPLRPKSYRAPSWSWASVDSNERSGVLHEAYDDFDQDYEIVECRVFPLFKSAPLGQVAGGYLVVRGAMRPAIFHPGKDRLFASQIQKEEAIWEGTAAANFEALDIQCNDEEGSWYAHADMDANEYHSRNVGYVFCLFAGVFAPCSDPLLIGLILVRKEREPKDANVFRRIGSFGMDVSEEHENYFKGRAHREITIV